MRKPAFRREGRAVRNELRSAPPLLLPRSPLSPLEAELTEITREFVARIVSAIRNASFADVAGLDAAVSLRGLGAAPMPTGRSKSQRKPASGAGADLLDSSPERQGRRGRRPRQTQEKRGELAERIVGALASASAPLGVRALASELATAPDLLAIPLRELRSQGKIRKLGEKRNTTYSL